MIQRYRKGTLAAIAAGLMALGLAACGGGGGGGGGSASSGGGGGKPGAGKPPVTLGDKNFTEQFILGQLYKQALEAKGFKVNLKNNIGSSEITDKALTSGKIDMYPEYTGVVLTVLAGQEKARPPSAAAAYQSAKAFEAKRGFTMLQPTPFEDADALAVLPPFAMKNGLKQIGDLKKLGSKATLGGPPENKTRFEGLVGLRQVYGLNQLQYKPLAIGLQYKALDTGNVNVSTVFTTDGQLARKPYVILSDPQRIFGFQNVAPVVSPKVLKQEGPAFQQTLNAVSSKITTPAMQKMNAAVDLDKNDPATVAGAFLKANGLK